VSSSGWATVAFMARWYRNLAAAGSRSTSPMRKWWSPTRHNLAVELVRVTRGPALMAGRVVSEPAGSAGAASGWWEDVHANVTAARSTVKTTAVLQQPRQSSHWSCPERLGGAHRGRPSANGGNLAASD
jgi:hypothetical protein